MSPTQVMTSQDFRDWEVLNAPERERLMQEQESIQQPSSSTTKSPDFLRIIPSNTKAKRAFSELLDRKKAETLSPHHIQYMVDSGKGPLRKIVNYPARSGDETPDEEYSDESETSDINLGFFKVSFDHKNVTNSAKWVIGRGSARKDENKRNVDILLAAPGSKHTRGLLAAHAYLRMHPDSGVWMIHAAPEYGKGSEKSAPTALAMLDDHEIYENGFRCLDRPESRLSILDMEFRVQFALTTYPACESYRQLRNRKLEEYDITVPNTDISGIPLKSDIRAQDLAVFSLGLGSGSFGSVYEAFDPENGELRIVKVIELKSASHIQILQAETDMVTLYPNTRGLVRQYGWCNSNGDPTLEATKYPLNIYIVQRKGKAFHTMSWMNMGGMKILKLFQDLLHGLCTIHQRGWMHRDITRQNILYFKGDPPEAALCDFGKLCFSKTDTYTFLAAWNNLPPELVEGESNPYDQSIDIWMLALALLLAWRPQAFQGVIRLQNGQISSEGLETIHSHLRELKKSAVSLLLRGMLSKDPKIRPTAGQALSHPCFWPLKREATQTAVSSEGKRRHPEEDTVVAEAAKSQVVRVKEKEPGETR